MAGLAAALNLLLPLRIVGAMESGGNVGGERFERRYTFAPALELASLELRNIGVKNGGGAVIERAQPQGFIECKNPG